MDLKLKKAIVHYFFDENVNVKDELKKNKKRPYYTLNNIDKNNDITHVRLNHMIQSPLIIPSHITHLILGDEDLDKPSFNYVNMRYDEFTPDYRKNVTHMHFMALSFHPKIIELHEMIPPSVYHLHLDAMSIIPTKFDLVPGLIPNSVTHLTIGINFNKQLTPGLIPNSVTHLTFNYYHKEILPGVIPESVVYLDIGESYNYVFKEGVLPKSLKKLVLGEWYTETFLPNGLPENLKHIQFGIQLSKDFSMDMLPKNVLTVSNIKSNMKEKIEIFKKTDKYFYFEEQYNNNNLFLSYGLKINKKTKTQIEEFLEKMNNKEKIEFDQDKLDKLLPKFKNELIKIMN